MLCRHIQTDTGIPERARHPIDILVNLAFSWVRYPAWWTLISIPTAEHDDIGQADEIFFRAALISAANAIDPALGVSKHNTAVFCSFTRCSAEAGHVIPAGTCVDSYHCSKVFGPIRQVRQVTQCNKSTTSESITDDILFYRQGGRG